MIRGRASRDTINSMWKSVLVALALAAGLLTAETPAKWAQFDFMIGKWKAETGNFSFLPELNGQTLVRHNVNNTPGQKHEDVMIVYQEDGPKAIYFDTEGHTIRYTISFPAKNSAVFASVGPGPKYRLSYVLNGDKLDGKFEVDGKIYLQWTTTRE
jgi:hypothetical protein